MKYIKCTFVLSNSSITKCKKL